MDFTPGTDRIEISGLAASQVSQVSRTLWDMPGLETAVHVDGTINDNTDRDRGWTVELRLPWRSLEPLAMPDGRALPPRDGDEWRMDFSRFNQYKEAPPSKDPGGWAWSPHGVWDSHIPELFTRVRFSTEPVTR